MIRNTKRPTLQTGRILPIIMLLALAGCATVDPAPDYDRARELTRATVAVEAVNVSGPQEELKIAEHIQSRLKGGLSSEEAVEIAIEDKHTLVVVTADHECGGLVVYGGGINSGKIEAKWTSGGHSAMDVPVFAFGPGAELFCHPHAEFILTLFDDLPDLA